MIRASQRRITLGLMLLAGIGAALLIVGAGRADDVQSEKKATQKKGPKTSESVVKAKAKADKPDANGKQKVVVSLTIDKNWHTYANPVPPDFPGIATELTVEAKSKPKDVKIDYPTGKVVKDKLLGDYYVYEDKTDITVEVQRAKGDSGPLTVNIKVQACSDRQCLLPATISLTVE